MSRCQVAIAAFALGLGACAAAGVTRTAPATGQPQDGQLSPDAPSDRPVRVSGGSLEDALASWRTLIAPYVTKARETYPDAKRRYLEGLPPGESFFVTTILVDDHRRFEQVFILVDKIDRGVVTGRIFSDIATVHGFKPRDVYRFGEADIVDWLITKPDGSEEGNLVGKYIDGLPRRI
jgi:hypothetical protein